MSYLLRIKLTDEQFKHIDGLAERAKAEVPDIVRALIEMDMEPKKPAQPQTNPKIFNLIRELAKEAQVVLEEDAKDGAEPELADDIGPMAHWHILSQIDEKKRTAYCSECMHSVKLRNAGRLSSGKTRWRCAR